MGTQRKKEGTVVDQEVAKRALKRIKSVGADKNICGW